MDNLLRSLVYEETEKLPTVEYQPESDKALHTLVLADPG